MDFDKSDELFAPFRGGRIYVGFSGGADSTALLLLAERLRHRCNFALTAIHFDHGLRGEESRREACAAEKFARERKIDFRKFELRLTSGANQEAAARAARLAVWRQLAADRPDTAVALGHHAGDRVENLLLRLARGSNVTGLAGLRLRSRLSGVNILRPLLDCTRAEIEAFLRAEGIFDWQSDSSNASNRFERNFLRNELVPVWEERRPALVAGLRRSLDVLEIDAEFIESEARHRYRQIAGKSVTPLLFWRGLHPALLVRVLRLYLSAQLGRDFIPPASSVARFRRLIAPGTRRWRFTPELMLLSHQGNLTLCPPREPAEPRNWAWRTSPVIAWGAYTVHAASFGTEPGKVGLDEALFDMDQLPEELLLSARRPGDQLVPFGKSVPVSLKKLRIDRKLAADFDAPVLRAPSGEILWAPFIRHSNYAAVTAAAGRCVRLTIARRES